MHLDLAAAGTHPRTDDEKEEEEEDRRRRKKISSECENESEEGGVRASERAGARRKRGILRAHRNTR